MYCRTNHFLHHIFNLVIVVRAFVMFIKRICYVMLCFDASHTNIVLTFFAINCGDKIVIINSLPCLTCANIFSVPEEF